MKQNQKLILISIGVAALLSACANKDENGFPIDLKAKAGRAGTLQNNGTDLNGEYFEVSEVPETDPTKAADIFNQTTQYLQSQRCNINQTDISADVPEYQTEIQCSFYSGSAGLSIQAEVVRTLIRYSVRATAYANTVQDKKEQAKARSIAKAAAEKAKQIKKSYDEDLRNETYLLKSVEQKFQSSAPKGCRVKDARLYCYTDEQTPTEELERLVGVLKNFRDTFENNHFSNYRYGRRLQTEIQARNNQIDAILAQLNSTIAARTLAIYDECQRLKSQLKAFGESVGTKLLVKTSFYDSFDPACTDKQTPATNALLQQILNLKVDVLKSKVYKIIEISSANHTQSEKSDDLDHDIADEKLTARIYYAPNINLESTIATLPEINGQAHQARILNKQKVAEALSTISGPNPQWLKIVFANEQSLSQKAVLLSSFPYLYETPVNENKGLTIKFQPSVYPSGHYQIIFNGTLPISIEIKNRSSNEISQAIIKEVNLRSTDEFFKYLKLKPEFEPAPAPPEEVPAPPTVPK